MMMYDDASFGIVNVRLLLSLLDRLPDAQPADYDNEGAAERSAPRVGETLGLARLAERRIVPCDDLIEQRLLEPVARIAGRVDEGRCTLATPSGHRVRACELRWLNTL
jgi:hypothetical protein